MSRKTEANDCITRSYRELKFEANDEERFIDVIASTSAEDAQHEVLDQTWNLKAFEANPVVLFQHKHSKVIGHAEKVRVEDGVLKARIVFAKKEVCEFADEVWRKVKAGLIRAVSVGFKAHSYRYERRGDREILVLGDLELREISVVAVPANPETLVEQRKKSFGLPMPKPPEQTNMNELDLIAKRLGTEPKVDAVLAVAERSAAIATTAAEALGLDAKTATAGELAKAINTLTARAADADKLRTDVADLKATVEKSTAEQADREVSYVIKCGTENVHNVVASEQSRKSLMAYRKTDPAGFAEDYKVALDSLRAFDKLEDFKPITGEGGPLAEDKTKSASTLHQAEPGDIDAQVAELRKKNPKLTELQALALVGRDTEEN